MGDEQYKKSKLPGACRFFLFIFCLLLLVSLTACGRRGDPVAIPPYDEKVIHKNISDNNDNGKDSEDVIIKEDKTSAEKIKVTTPDSPTGLIAIYTQKSIVLTWDEIIGQDVNLYKIYRSEGVEYILVGDTVTPAFTDKNIEKNMKYYYRVTAVGVFESLPSKEIEIETGTR